MKDERKTRKQLIEELEQLRQDKAEEQGQVAGGGSADVRRRLAAERVRAAAMDRVVRGSAGGLVNHCCRASDRRLLHGCELPRVARFERKCLQRVLSGAAVWARAGGVSASVSWGGSTRRTRRRCGYSSYRAPVAASSGRPIRPL